MSTASPVTRSRAADSARPKVKADDLIRERIAEACSALWWAELTRASLRILIVWLVSLLVWLVVDQWIYSPGVWLRVVALVALLTWTVRSGLLVVWPILRSSIRPEYAARSLERDNPQLHQDLTSYVTLQSDRATDGLASRVLRSIGSTAARQLRVHDQLPGEATGTLRWWVAAASALAILAAYAVLTPKNSFQSASRLLAPIASIDPAKRVQIRDVLPGDVEAVAGRPVNVSARIVGMSSGDVARVRWQTGSAERESSLEADPDSPRRTGEIDLPHSVSGTVDYFIHAGDATAGPFHLRVQDVPVVAVQSVRYEPPGYTGEVPHTSSSGAISAVDGTRVTLRATTNRAVTKAKIEFNPKPLGDSIRATAGATELDIDSDGTVLTVSFPLRSAKGRSAAVELESYRVKVWDAAGQGNPEPIIYPIEVIADLPPEVSIVMPRQSPKEVPINAQQVIEVHSLDADYGLIRVALELRIGLAVIDEPVLWSDPQGATGNRVCEYRFRPSQLGLQVGDTVQVRAIATDNRGSDEDRAIEPNVSRTDPIELVVVAVATLPEDEAGGDGLSPPDDRPASDEPPPDQDGSEQGDSQQSGGGGESGQQGGGGSGDGSESGEQGEAGQGGGEGEASNDANASTGGENSAGDSSSENQSGENQSGENQSGENQSGENQSGENQSGDGESSGQGATADPRQDPSDASSESAGATRAAAVPKPALPTTLSHQAVKGSPKPLNHPTPQRPRTRAIRGTRRQVLVVIRPVARIRHRVIKGNRRRPSTTARRWNEFAITSTKRIASRTRVSRPLRKMMPEAINRLPTPRVRPAARAASAAPTLNSLSPIPAIQIPIQPSPVVNHRRVASPRRAAMKTATRLAAPIPKAVAQSPRTAAQSPRTAAPTRDPMTAVHRLRVLAIHNRVPARRRVATIPKRASQVKRASRRRAMAPLVTAKTRRVIRNRRGSRNRESRAAAATASPRRVNRVNRRVKSRETGHRPRVAARVKPAARVVPRETTPSRPRRPMGIRAAKSKRTVTGATPVVPPIPSPRTRRAVRTNRNRLRTSTAAARVARERQRPATLRRRPIRSTWNTPRRRPTWCWIIWIKRETHLIANCLKN